MSSFNPAVNVYHCRTPLNLHTVYIFMFALHRKRPTGLPRRNYEKTYASTRCLYIGWLPGQGVCMHAAIHELWKQLQGPHFVQTTAFLLLGPTGRELCCLVLLVLSDKMREHALFRRKGPPVPGAAPRNNLRTLKALISCHQEDGCSGYWGVLRLHSAWYCCTCFVSEAIPSYCLWLCTFIDLVENDVFYRYLILSDIMYVLDTKDLYRKCVDIRTISTGCYGVAGRLE